MWEADPAHAPSRRSPGLRPAGGLTRGGTRRAHRSSRMSRDDPTFRMRREQLGELVSLTSQLPAQRRTAEMPAVELVDLLRKDRELDAAPVISAEHFDTNVRYDLNDLAAPSSCELAVGTVRIERPSHLGLALACLIAFAGGFALTMPLWW